MENIFEDWAANARNTQKETLEFLKTTELPSKPDAFAILKSLHAEAFQKHDCLQCANCCKTTPAIVTQQDAGKISSFLGISKKSFIRKYLLEDFNGEMTLNGVPCRFLNDDNKCAIYDVRPEACRRYPHTDEADYFKRPGLNAANTIICPAAYYIAEKLKSITF
jgi:uncharacterized protein